MKYIFIVLLMTATLNASQDAPKPLDPAAITTPPSRLKRRRDAGRNNAQQDFMAGTAASSIPITSHPNAPRKQRRQQQDVVDYTAAASASPEASTAAYTSAEIAQEPLWSVVARGATQEALDLIANPYADVNECDEQDRSPLFIAVELVIEPVVRALISRPDCDVNRRNHNSITPLIEAACSGNADIVALLLASNGIDLSTQGGAALLLAVEKGFMNMAAISVLLADPRINVNAQTFYGNTPLMLAVLDRKEALVELLLANDRVKPNQQNPEGNTALHLAASQHFGGNMVKLLLAHPQIDAFLYNKGSGLPGGLYGEPAYKIAEFNENHEVSDIFRAYYAGLTKLPSAS
jgi:ankyrin repeat protein